MCSDIHFVSLRGITKFFSLQQFDVSGYVLVLEKQWHVIFSWDNYLTISWATRAWLLLPAV
jgi:hypothetical protein